MEAEVSQEAVEKASGGTGRPVWGKNRQQKTEGRGPKICLEQFKFLRIVLFVMVK